MENRQKYSYSIKLPQLAKVDHSINIKTVRIKTIFYENDLQKTYCLYSR